MKSKRLQLQNIYLSARNKQIQVTRKIYSNKNNYSSLMPTQRLHKNNDNSIDNKKINRILSRPRLQFNKTKQHLFTMNSKCYSDRKNISEQIYTKQFKFNKNQLNKQISKTINSKTKHSNTSRFESSRYQIVQDNQKINNQKENKINKTNLQKIIQLEKQHLQGKNCRLIIIHGTKEDQHYVEVDQIKDVINFLKKQYPKYLFYKSLPKQITLDYFMVNGNVDGKFLNGQSLYLKPSGKVNETNQIKTVGLDSFEIIKYIGSGGFSKVYLCRFKQDGKFYAMKVIDKDFIVKNQKKKIIMNQRNIMQASKHNFIIQMKFAFQAEKYLVFVMQYCVGGQLFGLIKKYRKIDQQSARFYIIEILLGLEYLHSQHVVYRDIKPQNILLSQDGHVKIADLGLAKPNMFQKQLAYSFCGSPQYMSPQMILQVGHTYPVDYYCMGALLYQLLTGLPPFYSRNQQQIFESVLSQQISFPDQVQLSLQCQNLLKGLLCKDPKFRLGAIHGIKQILAHPWFGKNSYKKFTQKQISPPINFNSIAKISLDSEQIDEKHKISIEELKKDQNAQNKQFKQIMKNFYFDYRKSSMRNKQRISQKPLRDIQRSQSNQQRIKQRTFSNRKVSTSKRNSNQKQNKQNKYKKQKYLNLDLDLNQDKTIKNQKDGNYCSLLKRISHRPNKKKQYLNQTAISKNNIFQNMTNRQKY